MKVELIFERTVCDPTVAWTEIKKVAVDVPDKLITCDCPYHLTGMVVPEVEQKTTYNPPFNWCGEQAIGAPFDEYGTEAKHD